MSEYNAAATRRRFRPRLVPTLATIVLLPILVSLGFWQLDRADTKRARLERFEAGSQVIGLDTPSSVQQIGALEQFQRVRLSGRFDGDRQFLLDNMTDGGAAGYHVLTPFRTTGSDSVVLVDRGWLRKDFGATELPDIDVGDDDRFIIGRVSRLPRPGLELEAAAAPVGNWPVIVQFPDSSAISVLLGEEILDPLLLLSPEADDGFVREWRPDSVSVDRHMGYALQWFAMAATLAVIYLVVNLKKETRSDDD